MGSSCLVSDPLTPLTEQNAVEVLVLLPPTSNSTPTSANALNTTLLAPFPSPDIFLPEGTLIPLIPSSLRQPGSGLRLAGARPGPPENWQSRATWPDLPVPYRFPYWAGPQARPGIRFNAQEPGVVTSDGHGSLIPGRPAPDAARSTVTAQVKKFTRQTRLKKLNNQPSSPLTPGDAMAGTGEGRSHGKEAMKRAEGREGEREEERRRREEGGEEEERREEGGEKKEKRGGEGGGKEEGRRRRGGGEGRRKRRRGGEGGEEKEKEG
eukprot:758771-Hanusia_phi.AAC.2